LQAHSLSSDQDILSRLRVQLEQQWNDNQYAVSVEQASAVLDQLGKDGGLLNKLEQLKVDISEIVWDITVANSHRNLIHQLTAARKQAKDTIKKARSRATVSERLDDPSLTDKEFRQYLRAHFHPRQNTVDRLTGAIGKYSNPPGAERDQPRSIEPGRREDSAGNWLLGKLDARLLSIPRLRYEKRVGLLFRMLVLTGFLRPKNAEAETHETIKKKLSRLHAAKATRPRRRRPGRPRHSK